MKKKYKSGIIFIIFSYFGLISDLSGQDGKTIEDKIIRNQNKIDSLNVAFNNFRTSYHGRINTEGYGNQTRYGTFVSILLNQHFPAFRELDPVKCPACNPTNYDSAGQWGFGYSAGLLFESPIYNNLGLSLRAGYSNLSGILKIEEKYPYSNNGEEASGTFEHRINARIADIFLEPLLSYRVLKNLQLMAGFNIGYIIQNEYEQKEQLISPSDFTFKENGRKTRNEKSGTVPAASSLYAGLTGGIAYEMPLNKTGTILVAPELFYTLGLTDISGNLSWKINQIRLGASFRFSPKPTIDTIPPEIRRQKRELDSVNLVNQIAIAERERNALVKEKQNLENQKLIEQFGIVAKISRIEYLDEWLNPVAADKLQIEQFNFNRVSPLLKYIFFEENSAEIPARYKRTEPQLRGVFNEEKLVYSSSLDIYYYILNIIGKRMEKYPSAVLTLTGCNNGTGKEKDDTLLSGRRAEAISNYLQNTWKIPPQRLIVNATNLPAKFTAAGTSAGMQENQRVEFSANEPAILEPVQYSGKLISLASPPLIRTYLKVTSGAGIKRWYLELSNDEGMSIEVNELKAGLTVPEFIDWNLTANQQILPTALGNLKYHLFVLDSSDKPSEEFKTIETIVKTLEEKSRESSKDKIVEYYTVLLPFDDPGLTGESMEVAGLVKKKIEQVYNTKVEITVRGFTDSLGTSVRNRELANERASRITKFLRKPNIRTIGSGVSSKYTNSLPEGRFYNRCVEIEVKNPIN